MAIELPLDDSDRLVEPPLLDMLRADNELDEWVITFVPSDDVSEQQTETVSIKKGVTSEARYIGNLMDQIHSLLGAPVNLVSHLGGGNYTLQLGDKSITLDSLDNRVAIEVFDRLRQIAVNAELCFRIARKAKDIHEHRRAV